jgi:putative ABC transport system permease protein
VGSFAPVQRSHSDAAGSSNLFRAGFDASWEPDVFGGQRAARDAAALDVQASAASLGDVQVSVSAEVAQAYIALRSGERLKDSLEQLRRERRKLAEADDNNFNVLDTRQFADKMSGTTQNMTMLLGAVAAVSLVVGGIGIMNIMLVSVTERTSEIGVRLAIGALERALRLQFLVEAVVLAALGGLIGVLLATGASLGLARLMQIPYAFDPGINLPAFAFSAAIGVVFGYVPARRAARLDPIEALRHE